MPFFFRAADIMFDIALHHKSWCCTNRFPRSIRKKTGSFYTSRCEETIRKKLLNPFSHCCLSHAGWDALHYQKSSSPALWMNGMNDLAKNVFMHEGAICDTKRAQSFFKEIFASRFSLAGLSINVNRLHRFYLCWDLAKRAFFRG